MASSFLLYGANGYTGEITARQAAQQGLRPVLAGRHRELIENLGRELDLETRVFALDDSADIDKNLQDVAAVLHCAGPFAHTAKPMAEACIRNHVHYLDITGEIGVFESLARRDAQAQSAGITLMPGVGFDVVPTDCLAAHLKRRMPNATRLTLAFRGIGKTSRGTTLTMIENIARGGAVRRNGKIIPVPAAWRTRHIDFGRGNVNCITIPWGDVSTAFYSTGIPNIEVYSAFPASVQRGMMAARYLGWLLGSAPVQQFLKTQVEKRITGPSTDERARGLSLVWGQVEDEAGNQMTSRMKTPDGYALTVLTSLESVRRLLAGNVPTGFQTPSRAFGADFIMEFDGVTREDVP